MVRLLPVLLSCVLLSACASGLDGVSQRIQFDLVNMEKARCDVYTHNGVVKTRAYVFELPGSYIVERSLEPLHLDCKGLRGTKTAIVVPSQINETIRNNLITAGLSTSVDIASQAAFRYPEVITVDFTQAVARSGTGKSKVTLYEGEPVAMDPLNPQPAGKSTSKASPTMLDAPLCDNNDNKIRCTHKIFNPDVDID